MRGDKKDRRRDKKSEEEMNSCKRGENMGQETRREETRLDKMREEYTRGDEAMLLMGMRCD